MTIPSQTIPSLDDPDLGFDVEFTGYANVLFAISPAWARAALNFVFSDARMAEHQLGNAMIAGEIKVNNAGPFWFADEQTALDAATSAAASRDMVEAMKIIESAMSADRKNRKAKKN